jgi:hypothetical protein
MTFPSEIPVMIFTTEDEKGNEEAKSNITFFYSQLNNCGPNKLVIMGDTHYLHWMNYKEMSDHVYEFLEGLSD